MIQVLWDTSALIKRYLPEPGDALVDRIFAHVPIEQMSAVSLTMGELVSVVVRAMNAGRLPRSEATGTLQGIDQGIVNNPSFGWIDCDAEDIRRSLPLIVRHSINGTDALVLWTGMNTAPWHQTADNPVILVASDARLVRAARAEGLSIFNPESDTEAQLDDLLAG